MPDAKRPLLKPSGWGNIEDVVNAPLIGVKPDESWLSVLGMILFMPIVAVQALIGAMFGCAFVWYAIGSRHWRDSSVLNALVQGRPLSTAFAMWRFGNSTLLALFRGRLSRVLLFEWERKAFGDNDFFWHGHGVWCASYSTCDALARSEQHRNANFGSVQACVPDLFASDILIFLSNVGSDSEWAAIRRVVHDYFLNSGADLYQTRLRKIMQRVAEEWPNPQLTDMCDYGLVQRTVNKCIFYMMFGVWIMQEEAETLRGWRCYAPFYVFPRLVHRSQLNIGIELSKTLRVATVRLVEKYGQQDIFEKMNSELGKYQRPTVAKLCDELMFVIGFAGMGGTAACVESVGAFLQCKSGEVPRDKINFGKYRSSEDMVEAYRSDPVAYVKEACRLDPPVTSATATFKQDATVTLAGQDVNVPSGTSLQYAVALANRDPSVFLNPTLFDPTRPNLSQALTWNGAFGMPNDVENYPRLCPGRYLSLDVATTIVNHAISGM